MLKDKLLPDSNYDANEWRFWLIALLIFTCLISQPLFSTSVILAGHDWAFHLSRIEGMSVSLAVGQFPVKLVGHVFNGYGEMSGFFYPNLFFHIPAALHLIGMSIISAYNFFCVLINLATVLISWWSFSKFFDSIKIGAVTAMIYSGFSYRLIDIYSRSAISEALAMVFLPLAIISLWLMFQRSPRYWSSAVLGFTGVLQSHIISSAMLAGVSIIIVLLSLKQLKNRAVLLAAGKSAIFITLFNIWFYLPFCDLYNKIHFHMQDDSKSGYNGYNISDIVFKINDIYSILIFCGLLTLIIISAFIVHFMIKKFYVPRTFWIMLAISLIAMAIMFSASFWKVIEATPILSSAFKVVQFHYRFMILGSITFSCCVSWILIKTFSNRWILCLCCFAIASVNMIFLLKSNSQSEAINGAVVDWSIHKMTMADIDNLKFNSYKAGYMDYIYSDITWDDIFVDANGKPDTDKPSKIPFNKIEPAEFVTNFQKIGMSIKFTAHINEPMSFKLPLFYYPGYEAVNADGTALAITSVDKHILQVDLPTGENTVTVYYAGKFIWRVAEFISLMSLIIFTIQCKFQKLTR